MNHRPARIWRASLWQLALVLVPALVIGIVIGQVAVVLALALAACLAWQLFRLGHLYHLLASRRQVPAVGGSSPWDDMQNLLHRRQREKFARQRELVHLLRESRNAAAALPDAIVVLDRDHHIRWFNAAAARLLGLQYPHDIDGPLTSLVRAPRFTQWLASNPTEPLIDLAAPVDENIRLSLHLIGYANDQFLLVARDVSQLMRLEQVRRDFVANVSHELRTPLTVVHGYLDMIEPEEMPEYAPILHELRGQSRRMTRIVEDLLTLSRLEAQGELVQERVRLRPLLDSLRREALALSQGGHEVVVELLDAHDLLGSNQELHSAFSNLVSNAVRHTPPGGRITLRWRSDGEGARLEVIDTGPGIAAQHLPRLTERFYRVSTSRSRESGGTGLGLSIVKHVLQLHQARLDIRSELGAGSTFACVFGAERLVEASAVAEAP